MSICKLASFPGHTAIFSNSPFFKAQVRVAGALVVRHRACAGNICPTSASHAIKSRDPPVAATMDVQNQKKLEWSDLVLFL